MIENTEQKWALDVLDNKFWKKKEVKVEDGVIEAERVIGIPHRGCRETQNWYRLEKIFFNVMISE